MLGSETGSEGKGRHRNLYVLYYEEAIRIWSPITYPTELTLQQTPHTLTNRIAASPGGCDASFS